jgi:hypothetical protein
MRNGVLCGSVQRLYLENRNTAKSVSLRTRVELGSSTSTVALRDAKSDEKGTQCLEL